MNLSQKKVHTQKGVFEEGEMFPGDVVRKQKSMLSINIEKKNFLGRGVPCPT